MQKTAKRAATLLLTLILLLALLPSGVLAVSQDDAVAWLNAQDGVYYDLDGKHGAQCSDFVSAYMNWLYSGQVNPGQGYGVYNANYYPTVAGWNTDRWEVIQNNGMFVPQPGDIFVSVGTGSVGHTGVVISSDVNNATVIDQNSISPNDTTGHAAYIHPISWTKAYSPTYFIRFKEFSTSPVQTALKAQIDRGQDGTYYVGESGIISLDGDSSNDYILKIYRTPTDGETYLYWEGEIFSPQHTVIFTQEGYYSCCFTVNPFGVPQESEWVGWIVLDPQSCSVAPSITAQPASVTVAAGGTAKFTVTATSANLTYQWQYQAPGTSTWTNSPATGNKTATLTIPATTDRNGNKYRCKVTNAAGSVTSNAATLTVTGGKPTITTQPASVIVAAGGTAKFTVAATGTGLSYQWQYQLPGTSTWTNSPATGNKTATLTVPATTDRNGNQYRCIVTNASGSATSSAVTLTVTGGKPAITTQPKSVTAAAGGTAKFTVAATGTNLTYQWQYQLPGTSTWTNSPATGNKTATLTVPATADRNGNKYRCIVTNANGSATSSAVTLAVTGGKPTITTQPKSVTVAEGGTAKFTVAATGTGLTYQWQYQLPGTSTWTNSPATGNKTATLTVPATADRNGNKYRCIVTNASGSATSSAVTLTVKGGKPTITTQPKSVTVAEGGTAKFTVAATGTGLTYQWQYQLPGTSTWTNSPATGNKTATLTVPATADRNGNKYRCIVTNAAGEVYTSVVTLTVT